MILTIDLHRWFLELLESKAFQDANPRVILSITFMECIERTNAMAETDRQGKHLGSLQRIF